MGGFSWVFFDLDGTLVDHERAVASGVAALREFPTAPPWMKSPQFGALWKLSLEDLHRRYLDGDCSLIEGRRDLIRSFDRSLSAASCDLIYRRFSAGYNSGLSVYSDVPSMFFTLGRSVSFGVVACGNEQTERRKLERLGLLGLVNLVQISERSWGDLTPIDALVQQINQPRENILFVGSDLEGSVSPFARSGFRSLWLNRRAYRSTKIAPKISSLDELPQYLSNNVAPHSSSPVG